MSPAQFLYFYYQKFRTKGLAGLWNLIRLKVQGWTSRDVFGENHLRHRSTRPVRGITFVGDLCGKDSISKVSRDFVHLLHDAGIPFQAFDPSFKGDPSGTGIDELLVSESEFDIHKYTVVVEMFEGAVPDKYCTRHIRIPFWEFESGFAEVHPMFSRASEIAGMSDFNAAYYRKTFPRCQRVHKILYPLIIDETPPVPPAEIRHRYGIKPDDFTVFFNFSYLSGYYRKNPEACLRAFAKAFPREDDVRLVFKTMHARDFPEEAARIHELAESLGIGNRFVSIDAYIPQADIYGLTAACDCYMSLHRGEGFGLGVAEAMSLGKPVILTDYSATTEFCTPTNSFSVPYRMIRVRPDEIDNSLYTFVAEWADPDVDAAATALRRLYENPELRDRIGRAAADSIREHFSVANFRMSVEELLCH